MNSNRAISVERLLQFFLGLKNIFVSQEVGKGLSSNDYTTEEKEKLAGIAVGADVSTRYAAFTGATSEAAGSSGLVPAPAIGDDGKFLKGDGTWNTVPDPQVMTGATAATPTSSATAGASGLVPAPAAGDASSFLRGDGTWHKLNVRNGGGTDSLAQGTLNIAEGDYAHAEGYGCSARGAVAHAEGFQTSAAKGYSHAEGGNTLADGQGSHAEGYNTTATHKSQHVFGEYNVLDPSAAAATERGTYVEIVGNGTSSSDVGRSNARTLDWNGNETIAGQMTAARFNGSGAGLTDIPVGALPGLSGATSSAAGSGGIVPAPAAGKQNSYLKGNGTWGSLEAGLFEALVVDGGVGPNDTYIIRLDCASESGGFATIGGLTIPGASTSSQGLMSATDKAKLDTLELCTNSDIDEILAS